MALINSARVRNAWICSDNKLSAIYSMFRNNVRSPNDSLYQTDSWVQDMFLVLFMFRALLKQTSSFFFHWYFALSIWRKKLLHQINTHTKRFHVKCDPIYIHNVTRTYQVIYCIKWELIVHSFTYVYCPSLKRNIQSYLFWW